MSTENTHSRLQPHTPQPGTGFWARIRRLFGYNDDASLRKSLQEVIDQHDGPESDGLVRPQARSMMMNLLKFPDVRVDDIMVPRADIIAVEDTASIDDLLERFSEANHSRIPVFRNTLDDPLGMVHIKDLMQWLVAGEKGGQPRKPATGNKPAMQARSKNIQRKPNRKTQIKSTSIIREVLFVPPSMPAADLLVKMQSSHIHLAIVVDEYGGTDGLVSIEDVVEEIVGDIADEHDDEADLIVKTPEGDYIADARAPIDQVESFLEIDLLPDEQDEDADTLGGFVFSMLGRVPVRGELVRHDSGVEFEVLAADARRVQRLKIHVPAARKSA